MPQIALLLEKCYWKIGVVLYRHRHLRNIMPDKMFLQHMFKEVMGYKMDFRNPVSFNEKLQWLKLHDRKRIYSTMVDKAAVKKYVAEKIGSEYIIPTFGVYKSFNEIDFDCLPNRFVIKCTHDSGSVIICKDKTNFDIKDAKKKISKWLSQNWYLLGREWPYKSVPRRLLIEQYLEEETGAGLIDYKFYCFNGIPKFLYVSQGLSDHSTACISYVTLDWKLAPFKRTDYKEFSKIPEKPVTFDRMVRFAQILSKSTKFLRVDFFEVGNNLYFSELTFFPGCGLSPFSSIEWDKYIGNMLDLSHE